ncbi:hypothetical protein SCA6_005705 [Theobroma cacao]
MSSPIPLAQVKDIGRMGQVQGQVTSWLLPSLLRMSGLQPWHHVKPKATGWLWAVYTDCRLQCRQLAKPTISGPATLHDLDNGHRILEKSVL